MDKGRELSPETKNAQALHHIDAMPGESSRTFIIFGTVGSGIPLEYPSRGYAPIG